MSLWGNKDSKTATGTISITSATGAVVGSSTLFTTQAKIGNTIRVGTEDYQIVAIASDIAATVRSGVIGATMTDRSAVSYTLSEKPASARNSAADALGSTNVFGLDNTEITAGGDNVTSVAVANAGSRYKNTPTVTFSGGNGSSAAATATQANAVITAITVTNVGSAYTSAPTVAIAKPRRNLATTAVSTTVDTLIFPSHTLVINEAVKYYNGGGASATGLVDGTTYFVATAGFTSGTFEVKAAATSGTLAATVDAGTAGQFTCGASALAVGDRVTIAGTNTGTATGVTAGTYKVSAITGTSPNVTGFTLTTEAAVALVTTAGTLVGLTFRTETVVDVSGTGNNAQYFEIQATADAATAVASLGSGAGGIAATHAGWVKRTVGTGGRAGRVQTEVLVAMGSMTGDQADDIEYPDA